MFAFLLFFCPAFFKQLLLPHCLTTAWGSATAHEDKPNNQKGNFIFHNFVLYS